MTDLNATSNRQDQALYPDLGLIGELGLVENVDLPVLTANIDGSCRFKSLSQIDEWHELRTEWDEISRSQLEEADMEPILDQAATCLRDKSGLDVEITSPGDSYLELVDGALSNTVNEGHWNTEMIRYSTYYVECMQDYQDRMIEVLGPKQQELAEKHSALFEEMVTDIITVGYEPQPKG